MGTGDVVYEYSDVFRRQVVSEVEAGKETIAEIKRKYGLRSDNTIYRWLRKYGKNDLIGKKVRVESVGERSKMKELEKKNRDLEKALAWTQLKAMRLEVDLQWLEEKHGIKVKKKTGGEEPRD
jgi:transposase